MFRNRGRLPFDFSLCAMTVTVYHREGLTRQVLEGVHYEWTRERTVSGGVRDDALTFLLVVPYECRLEPGDKIVPGIGPENPDWNTLAPMATVRTLKRRYLMGRFCHIEARA